MLEYHTVIFHNCVIFLLDLMPGVTYFSVHYVNYHWAMLIIFLSVPGETSIAGEEEGQGDFYICLDSGRGNKDIVDMETDMKQMEELSKIMEEITAEARDIFTRKGWRRVAAPPVPPVAPQNTSEPQNIPHGSTSKSNAHDHDNDLLTRFLKLAPHEFSGTSPDPETAENWERNAECILKRVGGTTFDWVNIATFKLQGATRDWWESAELTESEPISWKRFKELFFRSLLLMYRGIENVQSL
ncbi:uncharacterized protein LOC113311020 isoform X2 [Papaver somniferum]|uniref:uncharacterized protein LOC113311020 isoform X2 n=1 Tax=Papaver somniferum TaxID=3469 RepID=UPI000E6F485F|nr:uncharacterized protein LOC113311020 isoform X2 [Papaver somniferum]